jgi:hypothetical protein
MSTYYYLRESANGKKKRFLNNWDIIKYLEEKHNLKIECAVVAAWNIQKVFYVAAGEPEAGKYIAETVYLNEKDELSYLRTNMLIS